MGGETNKEQRQTTAEFSQDEVDQFAEQARNNREHEQSAENGAEKQSDARHETERALEHAQSAEKQKDAATRERSPAERRKHAPSRAERASAYEHLMNDARSAMSPAGRAFSKLIHAPVVESVSETVGKTVARPNAILAGSFSAFVLTLFVYLVARYYGYPLSGSEALAAFAGGWVLGLLIDYFKAMATGGRAV